MGFETMRRWPVFVVFAFCLLLCVSLFSSWTSESELQIKLYELKIQLQECSKQQASCMEESLTLLEQRDGYVIKINIRDKEKEQLQTQVSDAKQQVLQKETQMNRTQVDVDLCKTELQSLKNLQVSKSATLDTLRLEKETLTSNLAERKEKISQLEAEVAKLKLALDGKTPANPPAPLRVTPAPPPAKQSVEGVLGAPINQPQIENNAKEDIEDINTVNDNNFNDFDSNK